MQCIMHLPAELLLHVALYLSTVDCLALSRVAPIVRKVFINKMSQTFATMQKMKSHCEDTVAATLEKAKLVLYRYHGNDFLDYWWYISERNGTLQYRFIAKDGDLIQLSALHVGGNLL